MCDLYSLSSGEAVSRWKYRRQEETETRVMGDGERSALDIFSTRILAALVVIENSL